MKFRSLFFLFLSLLFFVACGSGKPPAYGAYLKEGGRFVEIPQHYVVFGEPDDEELSDIPYAKEDRPVITFWQPQFSFDYLYLESGAGDGRLIPFEIIPQEEEGMVEIRPREGMDPDIYCLTQGDPFGVYLNTWCFGVGEVVAGVSR